MSTLSFLYDLFTLFLATHILTSNCDRISYIENITEGDLIIFYTVLENMVIGHIWYNLNNKKRIK